jgi:flagellar hook assembly protein FlgD
LTTTNNITWWRAAYSLATYPESIYIAFYYKNNNDWGVAVDDIRVTGAPFAIQENLNTLPIVTTLNAPKPNPVTNGVAHISFSLGSQSKVSLKIYDASGRLVKTLINNPLTQGVYDLIWNGRDDCDHKVSEGIYFYALTTDNNNFTKKLVFTR